MTVIYFPLLADWRSPSIDMTDLLTGPSATYSFPLDPIGFNGYLVATIFCGIADLRRIVTDDGIGSACLDNDSIHNQSILVDKFTLIHAIPLDFLAELILRTEGIIF
jgi:hypothetical protein